MSTGWSCIAIVDNWAALFPGIQRPTGGQRVDLPRGLRQPARRQLPLPARSLPGHVQPSENSAALHPALRTPSATSLPAHVLTCQ